MKKPTILAAAALILLLQGCATNRDAGAVIGGVAGGILGNQVGGGVGRGVAIGVGSAVGAAVGSAIGDDMDRNRSRHHPQAHYFGSHCDHFPTGGERSACANGVRQRMAEEQHRREQEAYHRGYGR